MLRLGVPMWENIRASSVKAAALNGKIQKLSSGVESCSYFVLERDDSEGCDIPGGGVKARWRGSRGTKV